jgi:hypothetical protein
MELRKGERIRTLPTYCSMWLEPSGTEDETATSYIGYWCSATYHCGQEKEEIVFECCHLILTLASCASCKTWSRSLIVGLDAIETIEIRRWNGVDLCWTWNLGAIWNHQARKRSGHIVCGLWCLAKTQVVIPYSFIVKASFQRSISTFPIMMTQSRLIVA